MSAVLKAMPAEPEYRVLHRVADGIAPGMIAAFIEAMKRLAGEAKVSEMEAALDRGDYAGAEAAIPWEKLPTELAPVGAAVRAAFEQAAAATVRYLPPKVAMELRFDLLNPRAVEWVRSYAGELIREVSEETRLAVRDVIRRAFEEGMHPRTAARHIREMVGLTRRQAQAVDNFRKRLIEEGVKGEKLDKQVERYRQRMLRKRAENIARTETIRASNEGQQELWRQAAEQGLIDPLRTRKSWLVTPDDRLCELCAPLDGQTVGLEEPFQTELGPVIAPPLHPQCRCAMRLVEVRR